MSAFTIYANGPKVLATIFANTTGEARMVFWELLDDEARANTYAIDVLDEHKNKPWSHLCRMKRMDTIFVTGDKCPHCLIDQSGIYHYAPDDTKQLTGAI